MNEDPRHSVARLVSLLLNKLDANLVGPPVVIDDTIKRPDGDSLYVAAVILAIKRPAGIRAMFLTVSTRPEDDDMHVQIPEGDEEVFAAMHRLRQDHDAFVDQAAEQARAAMLKAMNITE